MHPVRTFSLLVPGFLLLLAACGREALPASQAGTATAPPTNTRAAILSTAQPSRVPAPAATAAFPSGLSCEEWQSWPVVPLVSPEMRAVYRRGLAAGNDPQAFSEVGDGEIAAQWFLSDFDLGPHYYDLGPYQNLKPVIENFRGSFGWSGVAARTGFNTRKILDPFARDRRFCERDESPLACELRLHRPTFAFLSLGTNQIHRPEEFEGGMRQILEVLLSKNVVPILSTKGDNLEGDHRLNRIIACLALEYEVPLWNFWAAIQPLPRHGLERDGEHLTYGITDFGDEKAMQTAWTVRNLTALQSLDAVWRSVTASP